MFRAVLDTNVYVAALLSHDGAPARIVRHLADGSFDAVVSPYLLADLSGVLARPKIRAHVSERTAHTVVTWLTRFAISHDDQADVERVSPDPSDDFVVALARSSGARFIVSGDNHLLGLVDPQPPVISPGGFATLLDGLG